MDNIAFSELGDFRIDVTFYNWDHKNNPAQFFLGEIAFGAGRIIDSDYVEITSNTFDRKYFYSKKCTIKDEVKLSFVKKDNLLNFYIDEQFTHTMEAAYISTNTIKTNYYVNPVEIKVKIDLID
jgi:hypothetical protein